MMIVIQQLLPRALVFMNQVLILSLRRLDVVEAVEEDASHPKSIWMN